MSQRLAYYPDSDTLCVEILPGRTAGGRDAGEGLVIHYDEEGRPAGYEIVSTHPEHVIAALELLRKASQQAA